VGCVLVRLDENRGHVFEGRFCWVSEAGGRPPCGRAARTDALYRRIRSEISAVITFIAFEAAYFSEIMRAGIQSIPRGQVNAGQAVGMTYGQNMRLIVLPQAFRNMLPVLLTQTIILFQDTSLVYAIGAYDMLKGFETAGKNFGRPIEAYLLAAVVYFIMCYALSWLVKRLHKKIAIIR
jgi:glutamate/aspartate transport system permease protein